MKALKALLLISFTIGILVLSGCATLRGDVEPPSVSLSGIELSRLDLFEQTYRLRLRIQNPNDFDLPIDGMSYEVEINDKPFAKGASAQAITIPRYGSEVMEVEAVSNLAGFFRQWTELEKGLPSGLRYRIKGKISIKYGGTYPFDYQGEAGLPSGVGGKPL
jgi:LEA14-like dessication related protein